MPSLFSCQNSLCHDFLSGGLVVDVDVLSLEARVREELAGFGISCSDGQARLLVRHLLLVIEKNRTVNLTRIVDPQEAVTLHVVDSLLPLACKGIALDRSSRFLDLGTGAGFPGIPLGIMTGAHGLLVDSVNKKVQAVSEFATRLGLSALHALHARVEDCALRHPKSQDYVFARAVAQSNVLIEYASPLLKVGGLLVLEKARPTDEELARATEAAKICGMRDVSRETFELPHELGHREILIYRKVSEPSIRLPRKAGEAKRSPLGE